MSEETNPVVCPICDDIIAKLITHVDPAIINLLSYHLLKDCKVKND